VLQEDLSLVAPWKMWLVAALVLLIPPYSWSGLDYALWGDLVSDLCKWRVLCL
jgi:hypothetical protein